MSHRDEPRRAVERDFRDAAAAVLAQRIDEVGQLSGSVLDIDQPAVAEALSLASGRLEAALEFFRPVLERTHYKGTRDEVRDLERSVGRRRGLDASLRLVAAVGEEMDQTSRTGVDLLIAGLEAERSEANRQLALAVDQRRLQALRVRLEDLVGGSEDAFPDDPGDGFVVVSELPDAARRTVSKHLRRLRKRVPKSLDSGDGSSLRRSMDAAARLRYVLELAGAPLGGQADTARRAARGLQEVLVGVFDCDRTLPLAEERLTALVESDATTIRERGRGSRELDPVLVQAAPGRDAYRGLVLTSVDLRARREIEFERFRRLWLEQARQGVWVALEASVDG